MAAGYQIPEKVINFNLYNDTERPQEDLPVWFQIEGYSAKKVPVFHKEFDWG
mgnify:CR=1 FL=1